MAACRGGAQRGLVVRGSGLGQTAAIRGQFQLFYRRIEYAVVRERHGPLRQPFGIASARHRRAKEGHLIVGGGAMEVRLVPQGTGTM